MKKKENMSGFNFQDAIRRPETYKLLFPDEIEGMVIIALYERLRTGRYSDGFFSEEEMHSLFSKFQGTDEKPYYQKERNKQKIKKLLRFFLNYDEEQRLYSFQEYAYAFCEISEKTLRGTLIPTQIEVICNDLKQDLEGAIGDDNQLLNWFSINFEAYKTKLAQQTDFLHQQIDLAVGKLRKDVLDQEREPLELLKTVRDDLTDIQNKNQELRVAFEDINKINHLLITIETNNSKVIQYIDDTTLFFTRIQSKLRSTDRRLNRIQPKIKQLFAILRKSELIANTEKFIHFLLEYSELKRVGSEKKVELPEEVVPFLPHIVKPRLTVFKRDTSLFPTPAKPRKRYPVDQDFQKKSKKQLQEKIDSFKREKGWINQFSAQLEKDEYLDISRAFFEVLENDKDFTMASKVMFGVIESVHLRDKYEVIVSSKEIINNSKNQSALWKVTAQKK